MKVCTKCKVEKDESEFYLHSKASGKLKPACKVCTVAKTKEWFKANPDRVSEYNKKFSSANRAKLNEDAVRYRRENKDKIREARATKYSENSEQIKTAVYEYRKQNPHMVTKWNAARRARVRDLTPELTKEQQEQIDYLYWLAKDLRAVSGEEYHVDHIFPLAKGGLHEPSNLQILPKDLNLQKSTKVDF
jgi:5-methylcytosine-specific restriction endonuclease McrA